MFWVVLDGLFGGVEKAFHGDGDVEEIVKETQNHKV